jgi:hypothetical protein
MSSATRYRAWLPGISLGFSNKGPGAYIWVGTGTAEIGGMLHHSMISNDTILPLGASYWARLAEATLSKDRARNRAAVTPAKYFARLGFGGKLALMGSGADKFVIAPTVER